MAVVSITKENFEHEVLASNKPVLVDFWADWCMPCRMMAPVIDSIANENKDVKVGKINVDDQQELAQKYQIMGIPALLVFKDGKVVASSVGVKPKTVVEGMLR